MNPAVSVIIPIYNKESYIVSLIQQIIMQTFEDYECIIIDDGSQDKSGSICDELTKNDKRFIVKHISNQGVSYARNIGLDLAHGEYITFVDADDQLPIDYLEKLYKGITKTNVDILISSYTRIYQDNRENEKVIYPVENKVYSFQKILPSFARLQLDYGMFGWCWGKILLREFVGTSRFNESLKLAEDFDFYLQIYPNVKTIAFDNSCAYGYLQEAKNSSSVIADNQIDYLAQLKITRHYKEFLEKENAYSNENKRIVESKMRDYMFFSVFHGKREELPMIVERVHGIMKQQKVSIKSKNMFENLVLLLIKYKLKKGVQLVLDSYDIMRGIIRRGN